MSPSCRKVLYIVSVQCTLGISRSLFPWCSQWTHHSSTARARYGVSFVSAKFEQSFSFVMDEVYAISCYIGRQYLGSRLHNTVTFLLDIKTKRTIIRPNIRVRYGSVFHEFRILCIFQLIRAICGVSCQSWILLLRLFISFVHYRVIMNSAKFVLDSLWYALYVFPCFCQYRFR